MLRLAAILILAGCTSHAAPAAAPKAQTSAPAAKPADPKLACDDYGCTATKPAATKVACDTPPCATEITPADALKQPTMSASPAK